ncbi:MAG: Ig-like domain-containing protein [Gemmatimonadales bacterium]
MHPSVRVAASCCAALLLVTSCGSDVGGPESGPEIILIQPSNATLMAGQSLQFNVTATGDQPALRATDVVWSSSDARIAAVSKGGAVKAGDPGTVRIEAWWNGVRGNATVIVLDAGTRHTKCLAALVVGHPGGGCQAP